MSKLFKWTLPILGLAAVLFLALSIEIQSARAAGIVVNGNGDTVAGDSAAMIGAAVNYACGDLIPAP
ncbi:MAG: hypothetical protein R3C44_23220 [Chloroflexota bacterium]